MLIQDIVCHLKTKSENKLKFNKICMQDCFYRRTIYTVMIDGMIFLELLLI